MTKNFSTYLDAVRFLAALTVMGCHLTFPQFTGGIVAYQSDLAAIAVTTFFVLSGYVIAYVAAEKEHTVSAYAVSRMARVYSVALPALLLVIALDWAGHWLGSPRALPLYQYAGLWKYLPLFLTFSTQIVGIKENVLTDQSFWSLSYEVWYYIAFAVAFYLTGWRRNFLLAAVLLVMGPRILLLLPLWLSGCALYFAHRRLVISRVSARVLFFISLAALLAIRLFGIDDWIDSQIYPLFGHFSPRQMANSRQFASQYFVAACIAVNFFSARFCEFRLFDQPAVRSVIVYLASFTFSLYLIHRPLLDFYAFVIRHNPHSVLSLMVLIVLTLGTTWIFGVLTEQRKKWWRTLFRNLFDGLGLWRPTLETERKYQGILK
jgi:peptidoglycan/LPS O-acetylase OafA/YrhL